MATGASRFSNIRRGAVLLMLGVATALVLPAATAAQQAPPRVPVVRPVLLESGGAAGAQAGGRRPNVAAGVIGFIIGAAAGGAIGCAANRDDYGVFCGGQNDTKVFVGAALGGIAGAAIGALVFARAR